VGLVLVVCPQMERRGDQERMDPRSAADQFQQLHQQADEHGSEHAHDPVTGRDGEQHGQARERQQGRDVEQPANEHQPQTFTGGEHVSAQADESRPSRRRPNSSIVPSSARTSPSNIRISVVLPAPLGPSKPLTSPSSSTKSTPSTAQVVSKRLVKPLTVTTGTPANIRASSTRCGARV
jgi:hypothetical protein